MKRHGSVWLLLVRSSLYPVLLTLLGMAAAEGALFALTLARAESAGVVNLAWVIERSHAGWVFGAAFLLTTVLLCRVGCEFSAKTGCTLRRLSVSERAVFLWQAVCNSGFYFLLWTAQLGTMLGMYGWFVHRADPAAASGQTLLLLCYRCDLLHTLLPLEDVTRWLRNVLWLAALGFETALFPYCQRRGRLGWELLLLCGGTLLFFVQELANYSSDAILALCLLIFLAFSLYEVFGKESVCHD